MPIPATDTAAEPRRLPDTSNLHPLFATAINGLVAHGRAYARALQAERKLIEYRCPECDAITRREPDDAPESVACWVLDPCGVICTGRATRVSR